MLLIILPASVNVLSTEQIDTIYVDDDNIDGTWDGSLEHPFRLIREGINAASDGDTVFVFNGFYNESRIRIEKSIILCGENTSSTIIDGNYQHEYIHGIEVFFADSVTITNFTIQNGWCGIALIESSNAKITHNVIKNNLYGLSIRWKSDQAIVHHNLITENKNAGVLVEHQSFFENNNFIHPGCTPHILDMNCYWNKNYWDTYVGLQHPSLTFLPQVIGTHLVLPDFDWNPALEPYAIY